MFPNVRLQIAALFVSVVALSFGFGVFAAFRVNHEPLVQVPAAAPLQLPPENAVSSNTTTTWGAPFGSRFWLSETQIHGTADLPPLTPVVRHDVIQRTVTWIVVTGSAASAPVVQAPPASPDVQAVQAPLAPMQGGASEGAPVPVESKAPSVASAAVVGTAEPAAPVQSEMTSAVPEHATQEPEAPRKAANSTPLRRHVTVREPAGAAVRPQARTQSTGPNSKTEEPVVFESAPKAPARAPIRSQTRVQPSGQKEEPVVFQSAPAPYRPQKGTPVAARPRSQNSTSDAPVFLSAPSSQR